MNQSFLGRLDNFLAQNYLRLRGERQGCLSAFLFHGLLPERNECLNECLDIQQGVTVKHFETFIEYFLNEQYIFIRPEDILRGLNPQGKYLLITFDDGYYNNFYALEILEKFKVPAVFFIATGHVLGQKSFWWDVISRERWKQGVRQEKIAQEQKFLKSKKNQEIEDYIIREFGPDALNPVSDMDRPLTAHELKELSRHSFVEIGNHTHNHAILSNCSFQEAKEEMLVAQKHLQEITGTRPMAIAYPNGNCSPQIIDAAKETGFKIAITTLEGKNYLPLNLQNDDLLCLKRFTLWADRHFPRECDRARSDFQLKSSLKEILGKVRK